MREENALECAGGCVNRCRHRRRLEKARKSPEKRSKAVGGGNSTWELKSAVVTRWRGPRGSSMYPIAMDVGTESNQVT